MIAIKDIASGEYFDLMPGQKIPIEWQSPLMKDDMVLSGIGSLPYSLPFTDKNKRLCRHFQLINNTEKNVVIDVDIELCGNFWARGKQVVSIKGLNFDCDFSEVLNLIDIGEKPIGDIVDEKILIDTPFKRWWAFTPDGISYNLGINILYGYTFTDYHNSISSPGFPFSTFSDAMDDIYNQMIADSNFMALFDVRRETQGAEEIIYFEVKGDESIFLDTNIGIEPSGILNIILDTTYYGARIDWGKYQQDLIVNKITAKVNDTYPDRNFCFPIIKNDEFYGTNNEDFVKAINDWYLNYLSNNDEASKYAISPQFYLFDILTKLCNYLGIELGGNLQDIEQIYQRCFLYTNTALDLFTMMKAGLYWPSINHVNVFKQRFYSGTCMPGNTIKELFYCIQNTFNCAIIVRNNKLYITTKKSILASTDIDDWTNKSFKIIDEGKGCFEDGYYLRYAPDGSDSYLSSHVQDISLNRMDDVATYADLPQRNVKNDEIRLVIADNKFYKARIERVDPYLFWVYWDFYSVMLHDLPYANYAKDIDSKNSQTVNDDYVEDLTHIMGNVRKINVPHIFEKGNSEEFSLGYQKAPLRLLFYWGLKQGFLQTDPGNPERIPPTPATYASSSSDNEAYPFASIDNFDMDGNQLGDYALRWNGQYGLYENFWKEWLEFKNQSKPFTMKVVLPISEILQIDILKKIRIKESVFFIDRIKTDIGQNDRECVCTIDLYKL